MKYLTMLIIFSCLCGIEYSYSYSSDICEKRTSTRSAEYYLENHILETYGSEYQLQKDNLLVADSLLLVYEKTDTWTNYQWVNIQKSEYLNPIDENQITTNYYGWARDRWLLFKKEISYYNGSGTKDSIVEFLQSEQGWEQIGITVYYYNSNSNPIEEIHQWVIDGKIVDDYRISFTYDDANRLLEHVSQIWLKDKSEWQYETKFSFSYNENNLIRQKNTYQWDKQNWSEPTRIIYTYNNDNTLKEYIEDKLSGLSWQYLSAAAFSYNEEKQLIEAFYKKWLDGAWESDYKHIYEYNQDLLIKELQSKWIASDKVWRDTREMTYDRNGDGMDSVIIERRYIPVDWEKKFQKRYFYNDNSDVRELFLDVFNNSEYQPGARKYFTYNENNTLKEIVEENFKDNAWVNYERRTIAYDAQSRVIEEKYYTWSNSDWVPRRLSAFSYNGDNKDIETIKIYQSNQWNTAGQITFEYNELKQLTTRTVYLFQGGNFVANSRAIITYTTFGEPESELLQLYYDKVWYDYSKKFHRFDFDNFLIETKWDYWDFGKELWKTVYLDTYIYNDDGLLSEFLEQYYDSEEIVNIQVTYFQYNPLSTVDDDNDNNIIFDAFPNPANNLIEIRMNIPGNTFQLLQIIDLNGNVLRQKQINSTSSVIFDISDITSGIYILRSMNSKSMKSKKIAISK